MPTWNQGYVEEIDYTLGFYRELTPTILAFVALARGYAGPTAADPINYCELGCGHGLSANLHAAANPHINFYANDFNPSQIAGAQRVAEEAGSTNVHFSDASFDEYIDDPSLPQFDMIGLHGIYSWVSVENRRVLVDFIRRKLKPGGIVYVSFNALPGWAAAMPMRRLFTEHAQTSGGTLQMRIDKALLYTQRLIDANVRYYQQTPGMKERVKGIVEGLNKSYIAHEYFNEHWTPMYFADAAAELSEAKLKWIGSVHQLDHVEAANYSPEHRQLVTEVADPIMQETVRDFMTMQPFRRDLFGRGVVRLNQGEMLTRLMGTRFALGVPWPGQDLKVKGALGEAELQPDSYVPVLDQLATGPKTVAQLVSNKQIADFGWARIQEVMQVLVGAGWVHPALPAKDDAKRAQRTRAFNTAIMRRSVYTAEYQYLASPVTGGGVVVDRFSQMLLLAMQEKHPDPPKAVWDQIFAQGHSILKDGKPMEAAEDNIAELRARFEKLSEKTMPVLKGLGIA